MEVLRPVGIFRPSSVREHTVVKLIQSGDGDYLMNETRGKPTTGIRCPTLRGMGSFICPVADTAGHIGICWYYNYDYQTFFRRYNIQCFVILTGRLRVTSLTFVALTTGTLETTGQ